MPIPAPHKILPYTTVAATALQDLAAANRIPFIGTLCTLTLSIIPMVENTKFQRDRCLRILEDIHHFLCVLTSLAIGSVNIEAPTILNGLAQSARSLQKIESCLRVQRELGTIKRLFKQSEIAAQLDNCAAELKEALSNLTMTCTVGIASATVEFDIETERRHQELLELILTQSSSLDRVSSISPSSLNTSSGSFSLLPASPQIFHGRESELEQTVNSLLTASACVAILGPGGMGKTALALAAVHSQEVVDRYPSRHFIPCDSAISDESLVSLMASHLGLDPTQSSARHVIHHLSKGPACLVILDNFETPWEPVGTRGKVENFLSMLTDNPHVALVITMRGAERPGKVQWSHPFLRPLGPLPSTAARQIFTEIVDNWGNDGDVDQLLGLADNMPLAVQLVAAAAASEGVRPTLDRWRLENVKLLSAGHDKRSNLELSIMLSLSSPRMQSSPQAFDLLSLMSLFSDGITDLDLGQSKIPIPGILNSKAILIRTSLAYVDHAGRFKVLAPIREYVHKDRPPSLLLVQPVREHFNHLLKLWENDHDHCVFGGDLTPRITSNLGNLCNVLGAELDSDNADLRETIHAIILLNHFNVGMNRGLTPLMLRVPGMLEKLDDHEIHGKFITETFRAWELYPLSHPLKSIEEAITHFRMSGDLNGEAQLHATVGEYFLHTGNLSKADNFYNCAISLALQCQSDKVLAQGISGLATTHTLRGDYSKGLRLAREAQKIGVIRGDSRAQLNGLRHQAVCYLVLGDLNHSLQVIKEGRELLISAGMQGGALENMIMNIEAAAYRLKGGYTEARQIHETILHQTSSTLSPLQHGYALLNLAAIDILSGTSTEMVSPTLTIALSLFEQRQHTRGVSACEQCRADMELREGNVARACTEYIRIFANEWSTNKDLACLCLEKLADPIHHMLGDSEVLQWAVIFLAFTSRPPTRNVVMLHQALRCFGNVLVRYGMVDEALSVLVVALEAFTWMDAHHSRAECMRTLGDLYFQRGDRAEAFALWTDARPLFQQSLQRKAAAEIEHRLAEVATEDQAVSALISKPGNPTVIAQE